MRCSQSKVPRPSNAPHLRYITGLLLRFSRRERINVTGECFWKRPTVGNNVFGFEYEWKEQGWSLFQTLFSLSRQLTDSLHTTYESERRGVRIKKKMKRSLRESGTRIMKFLPLCTVGDSEMNCAAKRHIERIICPLFNSSSRSLFFCFFPPFSQEPCLAGSRTTGG